MLAVCKFSHIVDHCVGISDHYVFVSVCAGELIICHLYIFGEKNNCSSERCIHTDDQKNKHAHRNCGLRSQSSHLLLLDEVRGQRAHVLSRNFPVTIPIVLLSQLFR